MDGLSIGINFKGMNRFTFTMMNYGHDHILSSILSNAMDSGIKSISSISRYYISIKFNNGSEMNAWHENRYYAWLSQGSIINKDGSEYMWKDARPSRAVMARLYNMTKQHALTHQRQT